MPVAQSGDNLIAPSQPSTSSLYNLPNYSGFFKGLTDKSKCSSGCGFVIGLNGEMQSDGKTLPFFSNMEAEAMGLLLLLRKAKILSLYDLKVYGDSKAIVDCMNNLGWCQIPSISNIFEEIITLMSLLNITVSYIPCLQNKFAHLTALRFCNGHSVLSPSHEELCESIDDFDIQSSLFYVRAMKNNAGSPSFPVCLDNISSEFLKYIGTSRPTRNSHRISRQEIVHNMEPLSTNDSYDIH